VHISPHRAAKQLLLALAILFLAVRNFNAAPIPAIQKQGMMHGFLILEDENHKEIAVGDQTYVVRGNTVKSRLVFRFKDGSVDDETAIFKQGSVFQLLSDHHIQAGPSFKKPSDVTIDVPKGMVTWVESSDKEKKTHSQHMDLPPDLVNGIFSMTALNFTSKTGEMDVSYLAIASVAMITKPRVLKFVIKRDGEDRVMLGESARKANRFNIHIDLGGFVGKIAPIVGKQPPDIKLWTEGEVPVFIRMVGPLYEDGPIWTISLAAPKWGEAGDKGTE